MRQRVRARVFRTLLRSMEGQTPAWFPGFQIQILLDLTARGFGMEKRQVWNLSPEQALQEYAEFTVSCMNSAPGDRDLQRLYRNAYAAGYRIRQITGFTDAADLERLVFFLYRNIGITLCGQIPGMITVPACYFARFYTPAQCRVMSRVDAGIIAGICGGGKLRFTQRITEDCSCCRACFSGKDKRAPQ